MARSEWATIPQEHALGKTEHMVAVIAAAFIQEREVVHMTDASFAGQPLWLRILQFPLTRIIVLGSVLVYFMAWAQSWLDDAANHPQRQHVEHDVCDYCA